MSLLHRLYGTFFISLLIPCVLSAQAKPSSVPVPWDDLHTVGQQVNQHLGNGEGRLAQMCLIHMELLLAISPQASKVGDEILEMESRPVPEENDPSLSRFLPAVDSLSQAIDQSDSTTAYEYIQQLISDLGQARVERSRQTSANLAKTTKDSAILDLQQSLASSLHSNNVAQSVVLATEMQGMISDLVSKHQLVTEYAFNHYMVYDALGRAAFMSGNYQAASDYLQQAAEIPSHAKDTTMLDFFGPNLWLAEHLIRVGKADTVLKFLQTCKERFWLHGNEKADPWIAALQNKKYSNLAPTFADYGYLEK